MTLPPKCLQLTVLPHYSLLLQPTNQSERKRLKFHTSIVLLSKSFAQMVHHRLCPQPCTLHAPSLQTLHFCARTLQP